MIQIQIPPKLEEALESATSVHELILHLEDRTEVPAEIGKLVNLRELTLRGRNPYSFPVEFWKLSKLERLEIGSLGGGLPAEIKQLSNLRELKIYQYSSGKEKSINLFPVGFSGLHKLEVLNLVDPLIDSLPVEICDLASLKELTVIGGKLGCLPVKVGNLKKLKELSLISAGVSSLQAELGELSELEYLEVTDCSLETIPNEISKLTNLRKLTLSECKLTEIPGFISDLTSLIVLDFSGNKLKSVPMELERLQSLEYLGLANCGLNEIPVDLWCLPKLRFVTLTGNVFNEDAYQAAVQAVSRGVDVTMPRKLKAKRAQVDLKVSLSTDVIAQLERLGAKQRKVTQDKPGQITIGSEAYDIPFAIRQLVDGIEYPLDPLRGNIWDSDKQLVIDPSLTGDALEEYECVQSRPYIVFAMDEYYSMLAIALDDINPSDPAVFWVGQDAYLETEPLKLYNTLSGFLGILEKE